MAGLFPGSGISASFDNLYAARTRQAALETRPSGVPSRWHNPSTGNAGAITPTRTDRSAAGIYCREYQLTVTAGGRTGELWPEVGDSLRKGWRIVVVMNPPHLQERSDTPCWTIQLLPCVRQGMLKIR